jgi:uncharacterized protein
MSLQKSVLNRLGAVAVVLALVFISAQAVLAPVVRAQSPQGTITVIGEGKVKIKPDLAQVTVGVEAIKPTVNEASSEATRVMNAVLGVLKQQHVADEDIQTSSISVWLERPYLPDGTQGEPVYHVSNQVNVNTRNLDKLGELLDATIAAGANSIYGVTFSVADTSAAESEVRQMAVADARAKAKDLAQLTGLVLGEVLSVSEVIGGGSGGYYNSLQQAAAMGMGGGGGGPVSPGQMELTMQLQMVYGTVQ